MTIRIPLDDPLKVLVYARFPELVPLAQQENHLYDAKSLDSQVDSMPTLETHEWPSLPPKAEAYRAEIAAKNQSEIDMLYDAAVEKKLLLDDEKRFFSQSNAQADFDYWSKMPEWTLEEAIVLSFGKDPEIVTWERLESILSYTSPFVQGCKKLRELAERAKKANHFTDSKVPLPSDSIKPYCFVNWMDVNNLGFPKDLAEKVRFMYQANKPPKTETDKLIDSMSRSIRKSSYERENEKTGVTVKSNTHNPKISKDSDLSERERSSYLSIIGALLGLLLGKSSSGVSHSKFESQQAIIDCIHATYGDKSGLSKRNLEDKFAKAKGKIKEKP